MIGSNSGLISSFKLPTSSLNWDQRQHISPLEVSNFHVQIISVLLQVGADDDVSPIFIIKQFTQGELMQVKPSKGRKLMKASFGEPLRASKGRKLMKASFDEPLRASHPKVEN